MSAPERNGLDIPRWSPRQHWLFWGRITGPDGTEVYEWRRHGTISGPWRYRVPVWQFWGSAQ